MDHETEIATRTDAEDELSAYRINRFAIRSEGRVPQTSNGASSYCPE
jgi:hypothetical protein